MPMYGEAPSPSTGRTPGGLAKTACSVVVWRN
jgi:hypothetical protein